MDEQNVLWKPSVEFIDQSNLKKYQDWLGEKNGLSFNSYEDLWQWSVDHVEDFWESLWGYFEIIHHSSYHTVLSSNEMPGAKWFEGATLNYAEHIFRQKSNDRPALIFHSESKIRTEISWSDLEHEVATLKKYLTSCGITKGDRVVGIQWR